MTADTPPDGRIEPPAYVYELTEGTLTATVGAALDNDGRQHWDMEPGEMCPLLVIAGTVKLRNIDYSISLPYKWLPDGRPEYEGGVETGNTTQWEHHYQGHGTVKRVSSGTIVGWDTQARRNIDRLILQVLALVVVEHPEWQRASFAARLRKQIVKAEKEAAEAAVAYEAALSRSAALRVELEELKRQA